MDGGRNRQAEGGMEEGGDRKRERERDKHKKIEYLIYLSIHSLVYPSCPDLCSALYTCIVNIVRCKWYL